MKLPVISGKEAIKVLEKVGFIAVRQRGSHIRMKKVTSETVINITIPLHDTLDRGTLKYGIYKMIVLTILGYIKHALILYPPKIRRHTSKSCRT